MLSHPANAANPIFVRLDLAALKSTSVRAVFSKALSPIVLSEAPANVIVERLVQPANALLPIEFVAACLNPNVTLVIPVQFSNALFPITETELFVRSTLVRAVQFLNALSPIVVTDLFVLIFNVARFVQFSNALSPIVVGLVFEHFVKSRPTSFSLL